MLFVTSTVVLLAAFWSADFYRLWVGASYLTGSPYPSVALLLQVLLIATVTGYISNIGSQMLSGAGRIRELAILLACGSVINVIVSFLAVRRYGLVGVPMGTVAASVLIDLIAIPIMADRLLGLSVVDFVRHACVRPAVVAALQAIAMGIVRLAGPAATWLQLVAQGATAGAASVLIILVVGLTASERERFVLRPFRLAAALVRSEPSSTRA
jgi:O-antigen/teichoic acid export membrane protein